MASWEWVKGEWSWGSLAKRARGKKEFGIGLVVRVLNHKGAKTQKGHKEKSVKICLICEHIFLNTNGEWNLAKRTKSEIGKKGIWNWVSGEGKGFEPQRRYDAKGTQRKICENLFNP